MIATVVYDAHMSGPSVCADTSGGQAGTSVVRFQGRHQLCQRCPRRLDKVKGMKYKCGPGLMCQLCYNHRQASAAASKRLADIDSQAEAPSPKRVRRTQSDPGEPVNLTRKRIRTEPPTIVPAVKKKRARTPAVEPSLLLDHAHARRLALLADVATDAAHCVIPNASAVVFDT